MRSTPVPTSPDHLVRPLRHRVCAAAMVLALSLQASGAAQAADLSAQMASMFGNGALANVTGPGAYRSQTQNIYTGGELQLRFPARNYQFWSFQMPHISAGCGGVDAYLGSFSHIRSDQFKQMLESVAQSYSGLLFKAALKSINPLIESVIGDMQKTLEQFSQFNGNSCDMAQALLNSTSAVTGMTAESTCVATAMRVWGEDLTAARKRCKLEQAPTNAAAKASADPAIRDLADRDLNLVWDALRSSGMSSDEKLVFMNIAGTFVIRKPSNNGDVPQTTTEHAPAVDSLNQLLFGDEPGNNANEVKLLNWMSCEAGGVVRLPSTDCLTLTRGAKTIRPFTVEVRVMLEGIRDAVVSRTPLTAAQIRFINMTRVPVYRMLSVGYTFDSGTRNDELIDILINRYSKVIAYDYAYAFLRRGLKDVRVYLGMAKRQNKVEEAQSARLIDNVDRMLGEVDREHQKALGAVREANAVVEDLQRVEREMRQSLPGSIRGMLDMNNLMRGSGDKG